MSEKNAYIILENEQIFEGKSFGAVAETLGELVFTTSMVGYLETLTDSSYYGQVVIQTFPLIGNYGFISSDCENRTPVLKAYIVHERCQEPSNFRCEGILDTFLIENNIPGVYGVETRALTRAIRQNGVMNCMVCYNLDNLEQKLEKIKAFKITKAVESTTTDKQEVFSAENTDGQKLKISLYDFGARGNVVKELQKRGCDVTVFSSGTKAEEVLTQNPDGIVLSNGPGNPADNSEIIEEIKKIAKSGLPVFGVGLGHQLLALSQGGKTEKLKCGHRGANQPVKSLDNNKVYITNQNHGYVVLNESMGKSSEINYVNVNDKTCEGIKYLDFPAFSVQFIPENDDTNFLFDEFMSLIKNK